MPQPTPYERQADFTDHSADFPNQPQRGDQIDAEFDAIADNLGGLNANIALLQRDDGRLANEVVHMDSLDPQVRARLGGGDDLIAVIDDARPDNDPNAGLVTRSASKISQLIAAALATVSRYATTRAAMGSAGAPFGLPCYLAEAGHEGWFAFDTSDLSARVTADPMQGAHVAKASDPTGASGAWVRKYSGAINAAWFGLTSGASAAVNGPALLAAINYANALSIGGFGYSRGAPTVYIPSGVYDLGTTTIDLNYTIVLEGETSAMEGGMATVLRWSAGHSGIRVQRSNTSGDSTVDVVSTHPGGDASIIRRLALIGGFAGVEGEYHAINAKARVTVEDVFAENWQGDALRIDTTVGGGSANLCQVTRLQSQNCRCTVFTKGGDANACYFEAVSGIANRQANIWEQSFLGNSYQMSHGAAIARTSYNDGINIPTTFVHKTGFRYFAILGQEAWCSTNPPPGTATSNQGWRLHGPGGVDAFGGVPDWFNGILVRAGGCVVADGLANSSTFTAPYGEIDSCSTYDQRCLILNPQGDDIRVMVSSGAVGKLRSITANSNGLEIGSPLMVDSDFLANAATNFIGPSRGGTVQDGTTVLGTRSTTHTLQAQVFDSVGSPGPIYASVGFYDGLGIIFDTAGARIHRFRIGGVDMAQVVATGLELPTGKALTVNGTKVVGAQGAAVADPAAMTVTAAAVAVAAPTKAEFDALVAKFNLLLTDVQNTRAAQVALLARLRASTGHGLIA